MHVGATIIVLGDKTTKRGVVIEASMFTNTHGKGWARVGDRVSCHKNCRIAEGDPFLIDDGKRVARHGHKTTCGATLISSQLFSTVAEGGGDELAASPLDAPAEWSDTGRNAPVAGMQNAQFRPGPRQPGSGSGPGPGPGPSVGGAVVGPGGAAEADVGASSRSRDDLRTRPTRPPGRAPMTDDERSRAEAPMANPEQRSGAAVMSNPAQSGSEALPASQAAKPVAAVPGSAAHTPGSKDHILNSEAKRTDDLGKNVVKWGTGQTDEDVEKTKNRTKAINPDVVNDMKEDGLKKEWVEKQLQAYDKAYADGVAGTKKTLVNRQLLPRKELMEKILENW